MTVVEKESSPPVFSPVVALALVAVGALALLFYVVFSAYAPDLSGAWDGRPNALSQSAVGFAGLDAFLRAEDVSVVFNRGLTPKDMAKAGLVILTPDLENSGAEIKAVTEADPKLIILPKWMAFPDPSHPGWVQRAGPIGANLIAKRLLETFSKSSKLTRTKGAAPVNLHDGIDATNLPTGVINSLQTISGPDWIPVITDAKGGAVVARLTGTKTYVLAEPDLMNTHGLKDLANARVASAIIQNLRIGKGPVIFDLTLAGYRRSPNMLRLAFEPPLLSATLCALAAALLMGLHAMARFGAPLEGGRVFQLGKQALADNSAALIAMTRREHRIVIRYATAIRNRVARRVGAVRGLYGSSETDDDALNTLLDRQRREKSTAPPLSELFGEARQAKNADDALVVARKLYRWRREMIHER